jgi:hypothetical protein
LATNPACCGLPSQSVCVAPRDATAHRVSCRASGERGICLVARWAGGSRIHRSRRRCPSPRSRPLPAGPANPLLTQGRRVAHLPAAARAFPSSSVVAGTKMEREIEDRSWGVDPINARSQSNASPKNGRQARMQGARRLSSGASQATAAAAGAAYYDRAARRAGVERRLVHMLCPQGGCR